MVLLKSQEKYAYKTEINFILKPNWIIQKSIKLW